MVMRMLEAGGIPALTDAERKADEDNPHGYYELEIVKRLPEGADWVESTRELRQAFVEHPELDPTLNGPL